jgi:hypothetical protein
MGYHKLSPEVPGGLGDNTVLDTSLHPPRVVQLEFVLDNWFGADIIESFPVFLVTEALAEALADSGLGVFELRDAAVTVTPEADDLRQQLDIPAFPTFRWFHVTGTAGSDDFGVDHMGSLVVSDRGLALLQQFNLQGCEVSE